VEYEAGDTTPVAPWMRRGPVVPFPDTSAAACGGATHVVRGGRRNDRLVGTAGRDHLLGGPGADRLLGRGGDDCLDGGPGRDVLLCGRGEDIAFVGHGDRVKGCERVIRRS
jgi:hypothetical protein